MLNVHEVFRSISGEVGVFPQGAIAWFIRFQGCNLRCEWCDTERAQDLKREAHMIPATILASMIPEGSNVVLTGGEPYCQPINDLIDLVKRLEDKGCTIQIETNGSFPAVLPICHVMDYKTPSSGMTAQMVKSEKFANLPPESWVKAVVKTEADIAAAITLGEYLLGAYSQTRIAFSVEDGDMVRECIDRLSAVAPALIPLVTFNVQLHKKLDLA